MHGLGKISILMLRPFIGCVVKPWMWNPAPGKSPLASYFKEENYVNVVNSTVCRRMFPTVNAIKNTQRYCDIYSLHLSICRCSRTLLVQQSEGLLASVAGISVPSVLNLNSQRTFKKPLVIVRRGCNHRTLNGKTVSGSQRNWVTDASIRVREQSDWSGV